MAVVVREATRDDAETVAKFAMLLSEQHREYDAERFISLNDEEGGKWYYGSQTESDDAVILLAEDEGKAVGFAYIQYEAINYADLLTSAAWLHDIYIEDSARGSGLGGLCRRLFWKGGGVWARFACECVSTGDDVF